MTLFRPSRLALLGAPLGLAVALSVTCGGGTKTIAADTWVQNVCSLAADYNKATVSENAKLSSMDIQKDPVGAKATVLATLDALGKAQDGYRTGLDKLGQPDLKSGADVLKVFQTHNDTSRQALAEASAQINRLDPSSMTFRDDLLKVLHNIPNPYIQTELQKVVDRQADAQRVIDLVSANKDCAG